MTTPCLYPSTTSASQHDSCCLLQVFDGRMEGLKSLNRSSDAILTYSEETGSPIFTIDTSLMLSNLTFKSGAKGQVSIQFRKTVIRNFYYRYNPKADLLWNNQRHRTY